VQDQIASPWATYPNRLTGGVDQLSLPAQLRQALQRAMGCCSNEQVSAVDGIPARSVRGPLTLFTVVFF
jgi:hypothetical protein